MRAQPRSSILDPRSSILDPRSSNLDPRSSNLDVLLSQTVPTWVALRLPQMSLAETGQSATVKTKIYLVLQSGAPPLIIRPTEAGKTSGSAVCPFEISNQLIPQVLSQVSLNQDRRYSIERWNVREFLLNAPFAQGQFGNSVK